MSFSPSTRKGPVGVAVIGAGNISKQYLDNLTVFPDLKVLVIADLFEEAAEARAREFLNELMQTSSQSVPRDILMVNVTTVIGTHVGPNGLGFAAVRK